MQAASHPQNQFLSG